LLLPVLSKSRHKAKGLYCLNNGRQMMAALTLYAGDNNDFFPPNPDDGNTVPAIIGAAAKRDGHAQEFSPDILKDPNRCLVAPYLKGNISVFHCPEISAPACTRASTPPSWGTRFRQREHSP